MAITTAPAMSSSSAYGTPHSQVVPHRCFRDAQHAVRQLLGDFESHSAHASTPSQYYSLGAPSAEPPRVYFQDPDTSREPHRTTRCLPTFRQPVSIEQPLATSAPYGGAKGVACHRYIAAVNVTMVNTVNLMPDPRTLTWPVCRTIFEGHAKQDSIVQSFIAEFSKASRVEIRSASTSNPVLIANDLTAAQLEVIKQFNLGDLDAEQITRLAQMQLTMMPDADERKNWLKRNASPPPGGHPVEDVYIWLPESDMILPIQMVSQQLKMAILLLWGGVRAEDAEALMNTWEQTADQTVLEFWRQCSNSYKQALEACAQVPEPVAVMRAIEGLQHGKVKDRVMHEAKQYGADQQPYQAFATA